MKKILALGVGLVLIGAGCSYKYDAQWNDQDQAGQKTTSTVQTSCATEGQRPVAGGQCCAGLEMIALDDSFEACGKPGTGHQPRVCAAPGEVITAETPNCCAGLEPKEKDSKWVCEKLF